jgi:plastocyanin
MRLTTFVLAQLGFAASALAGGSALAAGSIQGTVHVAAPVPPPPAHAVLKDGSVCGKEAPNESVVVDKKGALANVVVFLKDARFAGKPAPVANAALDQRLCRYSPHVQAVTVGTPLSLMNNDAILHNVHANAHDANMTVFNIAMPIKGQKLPVTMRKPGLMKLQCDAGHTWMNGWIYVFEHPYYAVTDDRGAYTIRDVPPGEYTLELWHEPADGQGAGVRTTSKVKVADGAPTKLDLTMKL